LLAAGLLLECWAAAENAARRGSREVLQVCCMSAAPRLCDLGAETGAAHARAQPVARGVEGGRDDATGSVF